MSPSAGLRVTVLTSTRRSPGPGFGAGRVWSSKGLPFARETAARWVVILDCLFKYRLRGIELYTESGIRIEVSFSINYPFHV